MMPDILGDAKYKISIHEYGDAEKLYREYLEKNNSDAAVWNDLGLVLLKEKKFYEAADAFAAAADFEPENDVFLFNLGNALAAVHGYVEAKAVFEKAASLSDNIRYQFKVADMLGYLGEHEKALLVYSLLLTKYPNNPGLYKRMAVVQRHLGRASDAMSSSVKEREIRKKLVDEQPNASNWYKYAELEVRLGMFGEAKFGFERSLELEDSADTHLMLGVVLHAMKKTAEAMGEFEKAAAHDPRDFEMIMRLGDELTLLREYERAIVYYTKALELRNVHADAWVAIAYALLKMGKADDAKAFFEMAKASSIIRNLNWADKMHKSFKTEELDKVFN